ncbi:MAG: hypothetical protein R3E39_09820 [Anaerolineae bacterium]
MKQYLAALDAMAEAVQAALENRLTTFTREDMQSKQWYSPTLTEYRRFLHNASKINKT